MNTRRLSPSIFTLLLCNALLSVGWFATYKIAELMAYSAHTSLWYPPAALSFAALILYGYRVLPGIMLASYLVSVYHLMQYPAAGSPFVDALLLSSAHPLSYFLGASLLRLLLQRQINYTGVIVCFLILASVSAMLAAYIGAYSLNLLGLLDTTFKQIILSWWLGDLVAIASLSPFFYMLLLHYYPSDQPVAAYYRINNPLQQYEKTLFKLGLCLVTLLICMFLASQVKFIEITFLIFFLILPAMWLVYTTSIWHSCISLAVISVAIVLLMKLFQLDEFALTYQFTISVIAASMLFGTAVPILQADNQALRSSLQHDALTGALSRDTFMARATLLLQQSTQSKQPLCLVIFDLDNFKQVNDQFGHSAGDHALTQVCDLVAKQLRAQDFLGRFGGDELMLLLPNTTLAQANKLCDRLRQGIMQLNIHTEKGQLTASFGVCQHSNEPSAEQWFSHADQALLHAKQHGKNQVYASAV